ncbi:MAG: glycine zipper 2TM domain-containing protein [Deltaproteobacteria bacterium]|nr:glycine zipper 2TM domain-containing protein [Deltaproteobacteria bacterium]
MPSCRSFFISLAFLSLMFLVFGCAGNQSGRVYREHEAQRLLSVYYGTIIELREVTIEGENSGAGGVLGGITGGIAGSTVGSGRGRVLATLGGALAGAAAGTLLEQESSTKTALEFTIELDNGRLLAVVQENDGHYRVGDRVRLLESENGAWRVRQ